MSRFTTLYIRSNATLKGLVRYPAPLLTAPLLHLASLWFGASGKEKKSKLTAHFAQAQQPMECAAKGRELKHPLCPH